MSSLSPRSRRRFPLPLVAAAALLATACWNNVGVTCPPEDPSCSGEDLAVAQDDLSRVADLTPPAPDDLTAGLDLARLDLARPDLARPDLATCEASCLKGCCDDKDVCHLPPTADFCGVGGGRCAPCDGQLADNCTGGSCACGPKLPCDRGQRCEGGKCACDANSCGDGCCDLNRNCVKRDLVNCARGPGEVCAPCDSFLADGCGHGQLFGCSCGMKPACVVGQRCSGGTCVCDGKSCPLGCCDANNQCLKPVFPRCGVAGVACGTCNPFVSNSCGLNGDCLCGNRASCAPGQECRPNNAGCGCTAKSCPNSCCIGDQCLPISPASCGIGGELCNSCQPLLADTCVNGRCGCGMNPPCLMGSKCKAGVCVCDGNTCPQGCCRNGQCMPPGPLNCGVLGGACMVCDKVVSDTCQFNGGVAGCACGLKPPCPQGQKCLAGQCI